MPLVARVFCRPFRLLSDKFRLLRHRAASWCSGGRHPAASANAISLPIPVRLGGERRTHVHPKAPPLLALGGGQFRQEHLVPHGRQVGVISHVPALLDRVRAHIRVSPRGGGRSEVVIPPN